MYGSVVSRNCAVGQRLHAHSIPDRSRFSVWREGENKKIGARMTRGCRVPEWQAVASGPNKAKQRILAEGFLSLLLLAPALLEAHPSAFELTVTELFTDCHSDAPVNPNISRAM